MKRNKNARPRRLSAFDRETERRRREMLGHLAGFRVTVPRSLLHRYILDGVKPVRAQDDDGNEVFLTKPNTRPNPWRAIARQQAHAPKAVRA